jgi:hypothetical protein
LVEEVLRKKTEIEKGNHTELRKKKKGKEKRKKRTRRKEVNGMEIFKLASVFEAPLPRPIPPRCLLSAEK